MAIELRETSSTENLKSNWQQIKMMLEPVVDNLPKKEDRDYFKGILGFLIGKEPRISNIPKNLMFLYIRKARYINKLFFYRHIISMDYIKRMMVDYLNELAVSLGEEGLFVKYGLAGYQKQFVEQKVIQEKPEEKKKGWFF
jgi:hypothetical protein